MPTTGYADIARPVTPAALAGDVVALLDHLGIDRAHALGHRTGAGVALEPAVEHPDRVRSVVAFPASWRAGSRHGQEGAVKPAPEAGVGSVRVTGGPGAAGADQAPSGRGTTLVAPACTGRGGPPGRGASPAP